MFSLKRVGQSYMFHYCDRNGRVLQSLFSQEVLGLASCVCVCGERRVYSMRAPVFPVAWPAWPCQEGVVSPVTGTWLLGLPVHAAVTCVHTLRSLTARTKQAAGAERPGCGPGSCPAPACWGQCCWAPASPAPGACAPDAAHQEPAPSMSALQPTEGAGLQHLLSHR